MAASSFSAGMISATRWDWYMSPETLQDDGPTTRNEPAQDQCDPDRRVLEVHQHRKRQNRAAGGLVGDSQVIEREQRRVQQQRRGWAERKERHQPSVIPRE